MRRIRSAMDTELHAIIGMLWNAIELAGDRTA